MALFANHRALISYVGFTVDGRPFDAAIDAFACGAI
jgi:hypothetical protein